MRVQSIVAAAIVAGVVFIGTSAARADAITEAFTFTLGPLSGYGSEEGTSFSAFDPALGTLNSVTFDLTATARFSDSSPLNPLNLARYEISMAGIPEAITVFVVGDGTNTGTALDTTDDPLQLGLFTGPGDILTGVEVDNLGGTPASIDSTFGTETVSYTYTPATTSVPEPGSLALLGSGLIGLLRRRKQKAP